jgi:type III pantothenate kinase
VKVDIVADVGNSRIKWGVCTEQGITASASLPLGDLPAWERQLRDWSLNGSLTWAIGSVQPGNLEVLTDWLQSRGDTVGLIARHDLLPLEIRVDSPECVGVDRLLNAVAANFRLRPSGKRKRTRPAVVIDAGTAVTVDLVSPDGVFEGGAIFPGRKLMAAALHDYTALLPLVAGADASPSAVGKNTIAAIEAGIHYAVAGGINDLIFRHLSPFIQRAGRLVNAVFLTGGDAPLLQPSIAYHALLWPEMTLEGLRLSAEAQP